MLIRSEFQKVLADEYNLLSRAGERDLDLLLSRLRLLLLSRGDLLLLLLLSRGERLRDRDFDGERRPLRPPREPDLDLVTTNIVMLSSGRKRPLHLVTTISP